MKQNEKNKKNTLPWLNIDIWNLMKKWDYALKLSFKSKLGNYRQKFIMLRNQVTKELRKAKAIFFYQDH